MGAPESLVPAQYTGGGLYARACVGFCLQRERDFELHTLVERRTDMARNIGSWWIKDGIDGRRIEAQGFASTLDAVAGFDWTEDHGDSDVLEKDFVETANYTERVDNVDAVQMSSHGNQDAFSVWSGSVSTSDTIRFGKSDLEIFATHACKLLENSAAHPVGVGAGRSIACTTCAASITVPTVVAARTRADSTLPCTRRSCTP